MGSLGQEIRGRRGSMRQAGAPLISLSSLKEKWHSWRPWNFHSFCSNLLLGVRGHSLLGMFGKEDTPAPKGLQASLLPSPLNPDRRLERRRLPPSTWQGL